MMMMFNKSSLVMKMIEFKSECLIFEPQLQFSNLRQIN